MPSLALEVQRGSMPGEPNAGELLFMGHERSISYVLREVPRAFHEGRAFDSGGAGGEHFDSLNAID